MFECEYCGKSFERMRQLNGHYVAHKGGKSKHPAYEECVRLRAEERKSYTEIQTITGISKGTLSKWLKPQPLSRDEKLEKHRINREHMTQTPDNIELQYPSKFYLTYNKGEQYTREDKAHISETAVLYRLALNGFSTFKSEFEKATEDWIVKNQNSTKIAIIQVKWASDHGQGGTPYASLKKSNGGGGKTRNYYENEAHFFVLYDFYDDTCYVFSRNDISNNKSTLSIRKDAAERWDKIKLFLES
jgi:hypothetical protein